MKYRNRRKSLVHRGFTLIEILLVLVIISVIAGLVVVNVMGNKNVAFTRTASIQITQLRSALDRYQLLVNTLPSDISALWEMPSEVDPSLWVKQLQQPLDNDPWGHPYVYEVSGSEFQIRCAGIDGQYNTEDDIVK